jgi:hypothetical protein
MLNELEVRLTHHGDVAKCIDHPDVIADPALLIVDRPASDVLAALHALPLEVDLETKELTLNGGKLRFNAVDGFWEAMNEDGEWELFVPKSWYINHVTGGLYSHAQLTDHVNDAAKHFTQAQIDHGSIAGLSDNDHPQYVKHTLATNTNDFLIGAGTQTFTFVKKTLAEVKTILGLGSAAYTASTDYPTAAAFNTHAGDQSIHITGYDSLEVSENTVMTPESTNQGMTVLVLASAEITLAACETLNDSTLIHIIVKNVSTVATIKRASGNTIFFPGVGPTTKIKNNPAVIGDAMDLIVYGSGWFITSKIGTWEVAT